MMEPEIKQALMEEFGYVPDVERGEEWVVYQGVMLIVIHPENKPHLYERGCGGRPVEIIS